MDEEKRVLCAVNFKDLARSDLCTLIFYTDGTYAGTAWQERALNKLSLWKIVNNIFYWKHETSKDWLEESAYPQDKDAIELIKQTIAAELFIEKEILDG